MISKILPLSASGLYPTQHGIRENGAVLQTSEPTLTEILVGAGYEAVAFVSVAKNFEANGLDRGFGVFDDPATDPRMARETIDAVLGWLAERQSSSPLFLWVHLWDPHSPYRPSEKYPSSTQEAEQHARVLRDQHHVDIPGFFGQDSNALEIIDSYDGEIRAIDDAIGRLYRAVSDRNGDTETLWVLTSDHGEGLGSHNWLLHGKNIYNEQIRVPLIFHSTKGSFVKQRVAELTEHIDLLPTVLAVVGVEPEGLDTSRFGVSLAPLLYGKGDFEPKLFAFAERRAYAKEGPKRALKEGDLYSMRRLLDAALADNYEKGAKYAIMTGKYKYIYRSEFGDEFYDLESDPYETTNLIGTGLDVEEILRQETRRRMQFLKGRAPAEAQYVDEDALDVLRTLGYVK